MLVIVIAAGAVVMVVGKKDSAPLWGDKIGVVVVAGSILNAGPTIFALDKFRRDASIKAIVLRVDSPGGGVAPSQEIYREIHRTRRVKPVICSMGAVAASGGYYIAAACTTIVANPGTTTGSIGVIASLVDAQQLMEKLGVKLQIIQSGQFKGAGRVDRPLTQAEREMFREVLMDDYQQFVRDVASSRKMKVEEVKKIADGRILTGRMAQKLGLVDKLGNFHDAVLVAAKLAGIKGRPTLTWPEDRKQSWLSRLLSEQLQTALRTILSELAPLGLEYRYIPGRQPSE